MYKLVVVAGKLRGQSFELSEGENIVGRDDECDVAVAVEGVSKRHMSITVTGDVAFVKDLGSSNGTFLNGKIIKSGTVKNKDRITLPDTILQVVYVKEKKIIIKKKADSDEDEGEDLEDTFTSAPPAPKELPKKLLWIFQYKIMPTFHGINEEYEWRVMLGAIMALFIFVTISLTIFPVLQGSKKLLLVETAKRGEHFAEEIARLNAKALEQKNLDRVDTNFLDNETDVKSYELFDLEGRIVRPMGKLNEYTSDSFSLFARDWAKDTADKSVPAKKKHLDDGAIGIAQKIMAYDARIGMSVAVGVIAIRFTPTALTVESTQSSKAFLEALTTSALVALFFFGIIYYLTTKPLHEMRFQIEESLRGKRRNIESKMLMLEIVPLKNSINSLLQRVRELQSDGTDTEFEEAEDSGKYIDTLVEFMNGSGVPVLILDSDKNLIRINPEAEDITGIRETGSEGMSLLDVAREQGFAATVIELCDNSASNNGTSQSSMYELSGNDFNVFCSSLIGSDNFAKAFYITLIKDE